MPPPDRSPQHALAEAAAAAFHRQRMALLETLTEAAPYGVLVVDPAKRILCANRRFAEMWGIPDGVIATGDVVPARHAAVGLAADPAAFLARIEAVYADPDATACDQIPLADGRTFERHTGPLRGADGTYFGRVWFFRDVTARAQAETALRASEARQRAIIESSHDCIVSADEAGKVVEFNSAAEVAFRLPQAEAIGLPVRALLMAKEPRPAGAPAGSPTWGGATGLTHITNLPTAPGLADLIGARREGTGYRDDGTTFPVEMTVARTEAAGRATTAFLRDITAQKEAEARRDRAEAATRAALAQAEAADDAKTRFLANMSHEFRTPMGAVIGYAEMLLDPHLGVEQRMAAVHAITRNGVHLLRLINDVLDLAKIEAGKLEVERVRCRVWRVVGESLSAVGVTAQERGIRLDAAPAGPVPRVVTTDPTRLRQILDNLISNAVKFSPDGSAVAVRVGAACPAAGAAPVLTFAVTDTGIGIAPDELRRLFQPFTQADPSTTRRFGGTGLGLSICKKLAEQLGGDIAVRSAAGVGSTFTLTLPLDPADLDDVVDADELTREAQMIRPARAASPALAGRVLVAEDNPDNRNIVRFFLERAGLTVEVAENGRAAVEKASAREYDLILMDMQMPELDGYGAASTLRQKGYTRAIVALTAHAMAGDEEKCLRAGCNAYLTKPVEADRLLKVAARYLPAGDRAAGDERAGDEITQLVADYRRALPGRVAELVAARDAGDADRLAALAHKLSGSAGMYGLPAASETAGLLESACREGQSPELVAELLAELAALAAAVPGRG